MSYKVDLSDLHRDGDVSLTQQLVDRFAAAIEEGELDPGEKLPPTRELAAEVGVNHLTAARVYRRLAELGYVTASVGRGTFVRALAPAGSAELGDDWQVYALPEREIDLSGAGARRRVLERRRARHDLARHRLALAAPLPDGASWPGSRPRCSRRRAARRCPTCPPRASTRCASRSRSAGRELRLGRGAGGDRGHVGGPAGAQPGRAGHARAGRRGGDRVAHASSGCSTSLRHTGARVIGVPVDEDGLDVDALERLLARHEVKLVALQTACQNPTGRNLSGERAGAGSPSWRWSATSSCSRTGLRRHALRGRARRGRCASWRRPT